MEDEITLRKIFEAVEATNQRLDKLEKWMDGYDRVLLKYNDVFGHILNRVKEDVDYTARGLRTVIEKESRNASDIQRLIVRYFRENN